MLAGIELNKRNMVIIGVSLSAAIGLPAQEGLYANLNQNLQAIIHSGLVPGALLAIALNLVLPRRERISRDSL